MTQDVYGGHFARTQSSLLLQSSYADFDFMLWEEFQLFGYVKPVPAELKVKEYELYRSVYCGLCVSMKKRVSCVSRLTLSYDFVFLALIRMALSREVGHIERQRCMAHPTKKRAVLVGAEELDICAALSVLLTFCKLRDDLADERGLKKIGVRLLMPIASGMKKKAAAKCDLGDLETRLVGHLNALCELERANNRSLDAAADCFGDFMRDIAAFKYPHDSLEGRIAAELGRHIGRFIYIVDAADDLGDDLKSGAYNPFILPDGDTLEAFYKNAESLRASLTMELVAIEAALELIDFSAVPEYGEILKNIIYLGLPELIERIISKNPSDGSVMENKEHERSL